MAQSVGTSSATTDMATGKAIGTEVESSCDPSWGSP